MREYFSWVFQLVIVVFAEIVLQKMFCTIMIWNMFWCVNIKQPQEISSCELIVKLCVVWWEFTPAGLIKKKKANMCHMDGKQGHVNCRCLPSVNCVCMFWSVSMTFILISYVNLLDNGNLRFVLFVPSFPFD